MEARELILKLITEKSVLKQDVYENTLAQFNQLKEVLEQSIEDIKNGLEEKDQRLEFYYKDKGLYEAEVKLAGDILIFHMHTNVFQFDKSHSLWRSSYLKDDENNGYVGVINVYNFLADSFKFGRKHDRGYLIARIFLNRENHFMVQGKRQLGFLYNDFLNSSFTREKMQGIINSAFLYKLDFDLYAPPYQHQQEVSVGEIEALSQNLNIVTGKRLGFRFSFDDDSIE
ncbi:MAG: hypothetical protein HKN32_04825 [Flavobacteriales bacterium]|nr:hypothetical protein [Flavobacteriales bacterium]